MLVLLYGCTNWTLMKYLKKMRDGNYPCFKQILEAVPYKTAAVQPLTSHLTNHPSKTSKKCLGTAGEVMHSYTWTHQGWLISKNLHSSTLCEHLMPSWVVCLNGPEVSPWKMKREWLIGILKVKSSGPLLFVNIVPFLVFPRLGWLRQAFLQQMIYSQKKV